MNNYPSDFCFDCGYGSIGQPVRDTPLLSYAVFLNRLHNNIQKRTYRLVCPFLWWSKSKLNRTVLKIIFAQYPFLISSIRISSFLYFPVLLYILFFCHYLRLIVSDNIVRGYPFQLQNILYPTH